MLRETVQWMRALRAQPGLHAQLARRVDELESITRDHLETTRVALRAHTDVAIAASQDYVLGTAREHADAAAGAAVSDARAHTEAAVAASQDSISAAAREHAEAAALAAQHAAVTVAREHAEAAALAAQHAAVTAAQLHTEASGDRLRDEFDRLIADVRRELRTLERMAAAAPRPADSSASVGERPSAADAAFYAALEDRFRGDSEEIEQRQRAYIDVVDSLVDDEHPLADLGFGRGEWLRLARSAGMRAVGVDTNPAFIAAAREEGLDVVDDDLVHFLEQAEEGTLGAITLFQVVEHLQTDVLLEVLERSVHALRDGGVLIAETPNALNVQVAASNFWIDPTHIRPLHPDFLAFCAVRAGFAKVEARYANELAPAFHEIDDDQVRRLAERFDGPGDFALIAWK